MAKRIDAKNLNIYYGKFLAVSEVNFTIAPRSVTAFIGPSGCGKSTVLRTLNRMHEVIAGAHVQGEVLLDGENIYGSGVDPVDVRRTIGMVFQRPNPFPTMSIYDNVAAGLKLNSGRMTKSRPRHRRREARCKGANLWEEVKDRLDKPGAGLSGGQQQRLCIARAIAVEPQVLLMDEPCSALDPISTLAIEDLIQSSRRSTRSSSSPTTCSRRRGCRRRRRSSTSPRSASRASWSRWTTPRRSSPTPPTSATEDYISGRFG